MSSLVGLSIQGIRAFSPVNEEYIHKFYPITLILGPNGAGKTTIIECLRFICSGEVPPNTYKGKAWLHDPELINKKVNCVRAQVKLNFKDVLKNSVVATKNLELSVSRDKSGKIKTSVKTLDFILLVNGKTLVSTKCAEVESLMLDHLGVSKAVLTNVIFCHQEDSNWPLSEAKVLKEKFDQIFGSAGYVKALKKIKDIRKAHMKKIDFLKGEKNLLDELISQYNEINREINSKNNKLKETNNNLETLKNNFLPIKSKLEELNSKEQEIASISEKISQVKGFIQSEFELSKKLESKIKDIYEGQLNDLKITIEAFKQKFISKNKDKLKIESLINQLDNDLQDCHEKLNLKEKDLNKLDLKKNELVELEKKIYDSLNRIKENKMFERVLKKIKSNSQNDVDFNLAINIMTDKLCENQKELEEKKQDFESGLSSKKEEISSLLKKEIEYEKSIEINTEMIQKLKNEINEIEISLNDLKVANLKIKKIEEKLNQVNKNLTNQKNKFNLEELEVELNSNKENLKKVSIEHQKLLDSLSDIQKNQETKKKIDEYELIIEQNQTKRDNLYRTHNKIVKILNLNNKDFKQSFNSLLKKKVILHDNEIKILKDKLFLEKKNLDSCVLKLNLETSSKTDLDEKISHIKASVKNLCGDLDFDQCLLESEEKLESLHRTMELGNKLGEFYKLQLNDLQKLKNCPVCEKQINSNEETVIKNKIEEKIKINSTRDFKKENKELIEEKKRNTELKICENEFKKLDILILGSKEKEKNIKELGLKIKETEKSLKVLEDNLEIENQEKKKLLNCQEDAIRYDELMKNLESNLFNIEKLKKKISDKNNYSDIDDFNLEIQNLNEKIKDSKVIIDRLEEKKKQYIDKINGLEQELLKTKQEKFNLEKELQQVDKYRKSLSEKNDELEVLEKKIIKLDEDLKFTNNLKNDLVEEKEEFFNKNSFIIKSLEEFYSNSASQKDEFEKLFLKKKQLIECFDDYSYESIKSLISALKEKIIEVKEKKSSKIIKLNELRNFLDRAKDEEIDLNVNLDYLNCKNKLKDLESKLKEEEKKLGAKGLSDFLSLKEKLKKDYIDLKMKIEIENNQISLIKDEINNLEDKISNKKYHNIKDRVNDNLVKFNAETTLCEDLKRYYAALDKSVLTFHSIKMKEINQLIYKFWKQTYRGNDINTIKIISEEETTTDLDKRKTYNYRVVMVKGGKDIDMRGRCSAGQKVLACLVIRLALSEIFCINCGILALDEPTTNLDKESIFSFAGAIKDLINYHNKFKNFQIIIITHDEEFLNCLDDENSYYYKIEQDDQGYSKIERKSVNQRN